MEQLLKVYLANLFVANAKLHNLHWNVEGIAFVQVHEFTEKLYDDAFEKFDAVAESFKMKGQFPPSTIAEYLKLASIKEVESGKAFKDADVLKFVLDDIQLMRELALEIRSEASEKDDFAIANMMEDHVQGYDKNIWFLQSILK